MTPDRLDKRQNGRRFKENQEPMFTLNTQDRHGIVVLEIYRLVLRRQVVSMEVRAYLQH